MRRIETGSRNSTFFPRSAKREFVRGIGLLALDRALEAEIEVGQGLNAGSRWARVAPGLRSGGRPLTTARNGAGS